MYQWRKISETERDSLLKARQRAENPWHAPQHRAAMRTHEFHVCAACFEHRPIIGERAARMDDFAEALLKHCADQTVPVRAWCLLPDHYHLLVKTDAILGFLRSLGMLHGRSSFQWNREDSKRGRKVFYRAVEREIRSERHRFATLNYIHNNPVHHRHVEDWTQWRWSSLPAFLEEHGPDEVRRIWEAYPVRDYGKGWDDSSPGQAFPSHSEPPTHSRIQGQKPSLRTRARSDAFRRFPPPFRTADPFRPEGLKPSLQTHARSDAFRRCPPPFRTADPLRTEGLKPSLRTHARSHAFRRFPPVSNRRPIPNPRPKALPRRKKASFSRPP